MNRIHIGSRVKVTGGKLFCGLTGTVVDRPRVNVSWVELDGDGIKSKLFFSDNELELIEENGMNFKFAVGDRVRVTSGPAHYTGKMGTIKEVVQHARRDFPYRVLIDGHLTLSGFSEGEVELVKNETTELTPRRKANEDRLAMIDSAIKRTLLNDNPLPVEWIEERNDILAYLNK